MNFATKLKTVLLICFLLTLSLHAKANSGPQFSDHELDVLKATEAVIQLFKQHPASVWPGFDLCRQPFIVYVPGKWALLFNAPPETAEFGPCPPGWPNLGTTVLFHGGQFKDLVGQLAFDFPVAGLKLAAIGIPEGLTGNREFRAAGLFDFITHENFHQFQNQNFGEIPWEREERYPILDAHNSALAYLEMCLLRDALGAMRKGDRKETESLARPFAVVRADRWNRGSPFIRKYEQGQEIREGTAQYVQTKSLELLKNLEYTSEIKAKPLKEEITTISLHAYRLNDFAARMRDNHIEPDDMIRNRIYPVGATLGLLADDLGIEWKTNAQKAGPDFAFHELILEKLLSPGRTDPGLLDETKKLYNFDRILAATQKSIEAYQNEFQRALDRFESQPGTRIEVGFSYRSLSRSRVGLEKKWVMNDGAISLNPKFRTYTLKNSDLILQIQDNGILEKDDWDGKKKQVIFFSPEVASISVDGNVVDLASPFTREFKVLEIEGRGFMIKAQKAGTISISGKTISIILLSP